MYQSYFSRCKAKSLRNFLVNVWFFAGKGQKISDNFFIILKYSKKQNFFLQIFALAFKNGWIKNTLFWIFSLEFQRFFSITRTFFFSHSRSEQFWRQNTISCLDSKFLETKKVSFDWICLLFGPKPKTPKPVHTVLP